MYRVSREGRRASNGDPDTPPRSTRQPLAFSDNAKRRPGMSTGGGDRRVSPWLKAVGVIFALMFIRRVRVA